MFPQLESTFQNDEEFSLLHAQMKQVLWGSSMKHMQVPGRSIYNYEGMKAWMCCPAFRDSLAWLWDAAHDATAARILRKTAKTQGVHSSPWELSMNTCLPSVLCRVVSESQILALLSLALQIWPCAGKEEGHLHLDHLLLTYLSNTRTQQVMNLTFPVAFDSLVT